MKVKSFFLLLIAFTFFSCQDNRFKEISPKEANSLVSSSQVVVLDVRTPDEYFRGHIKSAKNFDFLSESFFEKIKSLDKASPYIICSRDGRTGKIVARVLKAKGFENLYNIKDGIIGWTEAGLPLEKGIKGREK